MGNEITPADNIIEAAVAGTEHLSPEGRADCTTGDEPAKLEPIRGTPESAAWFRAALEALGETQSSMARLMKHKGDDRQPATIARHMRRMATGEARVSGEMRVILTMM